MQKAVIFLFCFFSVGLVFAQYPSATFTVPSETCIEENVKIDNTSTNAVSYEWDFCVNSLQNMPNVEENAIVSEASLPMGISVVYDSASWYGFVSDFSSSKFLRLQFGQSLDNIVQVSEVNMGGILNHSSDNAFYNEGHQWYSLVVDKANNNLLRLSFSSGLNESPVVENLGNLDGWTGLRGVDISSDENKVVAFVSSFDDSKLTLLDFGSSITNVPTVINISSISSLSGPIGTALVKEDSLWYGLVASYSNGKILKLNFGSNLSATPTVAVLAGVTNPTEIDIVKEGAFYQGFITTGNGKITRLYFRDGLDLTPQLIELTNIGVLNNIYGFSLAYSHSSWFGFTIDGQSKQLYKLNFLESCEEVSDLFLVEESPTVSFVQAGTYGITLTAYDTFGNSDVITQFFTVTEDQAPTIDIQISSQCIDTQSILSAISDQALTSATWIINSDTFTGTSIDYIFPSLGTYTVTLEVKSENGCSNRITKEITIYEPPTPNFSIPDGLLCSNGAIAFTNLTNTKGADDLITYQWDFNGEGTSTAINPSFTFTTGGTKTVTLTASIPGCSQTYSLSFEVVQGPVVGFEVPYICQGVEVQYENVTHGEDITNYHWDFGDGGSYTSTSAVSPFYNYQLAGAYTVVLSVENASGCINTFSRTVQVHARPKVSFLAEVACVGTPVRFTDQTTSGTTSNVVDWLWDFGDGKGTANIKNPAYTYTHPGTYQVKLVAQTSAGCKDSLVQYIIVETPVIADFTPEVVCQAEGATPYTVQFHDQSTVAVGNRITQWLWTIQGETFTTQDVQYIFDTPGVYKVTLTTTAASACNATITQTIEVLAEPEVAFDYTPACAGVPFSFMNQTISQEGIISRYSWDFGGVGASFDRDPEFTFAHPGNYTVRLMAQTQDGCIFSSEQQVSVPAQPVAQFTPSVTFGAYPLTVQFNNQSTDATQYIWQIGEEDTLTETSPVYTFTQPGQYNVILTAVHESGCLSIENQQITVVDPVWDLVMERIRILPAEENGAYQVVLTIRNAGTVAVAHFPMSIKVDQLLELKENFQGHLAPGEKISYPVSFTLSNQFNQNVSVRYICATLLNGDVNLPDIHLTDNRACANMSGDFNSIVPYPNPVKDVLDVSLVLPQVEPVTMMINNSKGSQMKAYHFTETRRGLNSFALDMSGLAQGVYLVQVHYLGKVKTYRVVVQP